MSENSATGLAHWCVERVNNAERKVHREAQQFKDIHFHCVYFLRRPMRCWTIFMNSMYSCSSSSRINKIEIRQATEINAVKGRRNSIPSLGDHEILMEVLLMRDSLTASDIQWNNLRTSPDCFLLFFAPTAK